MQTQALPVITSKWRLSRWARQIPHIKACQTNLTDLDDEQLRKASLALRYRAKSGESLDHLLPEAFALVREAARRTLGIEHYDVQLLGGIAMHHRSIAEMQTGEGKTLTASLPMYLASLTGKAVHLATANDYLARRDKEWMGPIYASLGISVGVVESAMARPQRQKAYQCDITYGTAKEFGFDFLRDRLLIRRTQEGDADLLGGMMGTQGGTIAEGPAQREPFFALVDEADSILIDEARTPLIISALPDANHQAVIEAYRWSASVANQFIEDDHYEYDHKQKTVELNIDGRRLVRDLSKPSALASVAMYDIYEYAERSVNVDCDFIRDRHYVERDGEIVIVDEFTGRLAEGRKWRAGIHQAVEAKEGVEVTVPTGQAARVTVQDYFLRYERLAGMTGTAADSARELKRIYKMKFVAIPTNRPLIRQRLADEVFGTTDAKMAAIAEEVAEIHATGRPVLIGTRSIDKSEQLSARLNAANIPHRVLNAHNIAAEADIVAQAGRLGRVTIATNMAGRGTDIILGGNSREMAWVALQQKYASRLEVPAEEWDGLAGQIEEENNLVQEREEVVRSGGLYIICTELHDSARIDRQLIGRCGRQSDPGSHRQYLALDDDILQHGLGPNQSMRLRQQGEKAPSESFPELTRLFRRAQARVERQHFRQRQILMHYEKERTKMQQQMGQDPYLDTPGS